jgi:hypothetical protein
MAKLKPRPMSVPSPVELGNVSLDQLLDGPRPGAEDRVERGPEAPVADRQWREHRSAIHRLLVGGPFDPRQILALSPPELVAWRAARRRWLAAHVTEARG